jgi:hypothetical protein
VCSPASVTPFPLASPKRTPTFNVVEALAVEVEPTFDRVIVALSCPDPANPCDPETWNDPLEPVTFPAESVPSPQLMIALRSDAEVDKFVSVKLASVTSLKRIFSVSVRPVSARVSTVAVDPLPVKETVSVLSRPPFALRMLSLSLPLP